MTVDEAQAQVFGNLKKGSTCPCCFQFAKSYERKVTSEGAHALIELYKRSKENKDYHHISSLQKYAGGGALAKLAYWGLIEPMPKQKKKKSRTSGFWRITDDGIEFVEQRVTVTKYATVYNNTTLEFHGEQVSILDALATDFDYDELMRGI